MYKISESANAPYGSAPNERGIEQLLDSSVVVINKQAGPSSHQIAAWLRDSFELDSTGHGGTLDPNVKVYCLYLLVELLKLSRSCRNQLKNMFV